MDAGKFEFKNMKEKYLRFFFHPEQRIKFVFHVSTSILVEREPLVINLPFVKANLKASALSPFNPGRFGLSSNSTTNHIAVVSFFFISGKDPKNARRFSVSEARRVLRRCFYLIPKAYWKGKTKYSQMKKQLLQVLILNHRKFTQG